MEDSRQTRVSEEVFDVNSRREELRVVDHVVAMVVRFFDDVANL